MNSFKNLFLLVALGMGSMMLGMTSCSSDDDKSGQSSSAVETQLSQMTKTVKEQSTLVVEKNNLLAEKEVEKGSTGDVSNNEEITQLKEELESLNTALSSALVSLNSYLESISIMISTDVFNAAKDAKSEGEKVNTNATTLIEETDKYLSNPTTETLNTLVEKAKECITCLGNHTKLVETKINGELKYRKAIQLWAGGPYFAEFNVGATIDDYGTVQDWSTLVSSLPSGTTSIPVDNESVKKFFKYVGNYFSWGATSQYQDNNTPGPASSEVTTDIKGTTYDAATVNWGEKWRMPTEDELYSLTCNTKLWKTNGTTRKFRGSSIVGFCFIGEGDYSVDTVFFPLAGYCNGGSFYYVGAGGYYWSSVPSAEDYAWGLGFGDGGAGMSSNFRYFGQSVRAVCVQN